MTNLLLHLLVVVLVLALVARLAPDQPFAGFAAALLFGLHPVLTEVVQVPAFREDLLLGVFILLYLLAGATQHQLGWWRGVVSLVALALALASKESAAVAPVLLLWTWICFPAVRPSRRAAALLLGTHGLLVIGFAALWLRGGSLQAWSPEWPPAAIRFPANLLTAPLLWLKALRTLVWPFPLLADYVVSPVLRISDWRFQIGTSVFLAGVALALASVRRRPWLAFGLGWMLIGFLPVSNLIPLYNPWAERYLYFPAIGFAVLLAWGLSLISARRWRSGLLAAAAAAYAALCLARLADWADDYTLWSRTLAREPQSARAHTWVGIELRRRGTLDQAFSHFLKADELNPRDVTALINIAILYGEQGRVGEAEAALREAVRRRPGKADAHWNLAVALQAQGKEKDALAEVARTLELDPRHETARSLTREIAARDKEASVTPD